MIDNGLDAVKVLPELAQLEMVRAAALVARDRTDGTVRMTDVVWFEPLVVAAGAEVRVDLEHGEWTVYVDTDDDAGSHGVVHVLDDVPPDRVALGAGLVELGGTEEGPDAVLLGRHVAACLEQVCEQAGWDDRGVRLLRAAEVILSGQIRDAIRGAVEFSLDTARNVATVDVDLLDNDGVRLVRLHALEVSGAVVTEEVAAAVAGPGRRVEWAGWSLRDCVLAELSDVVSRVLGVPAERVDVAVELREFGFDSISLVEFAGVLGELWGVELTPDVFFSHPSLTELAGHLLADHGTLMAEFYAEPVAGAVRVPVARVGGVRRRAPRRHRPAEVDAGGMAVIGMSGRFPGARTVDEFWQVLRDGRCVVGDGPAERGGSWARPAPAGPANRAVGVLPGAAEFDPLFFEISPLEAEMMDPRQRLLLQEMWSALEDAGLGRGRLAGERVGVFVGVEEGDYRTLVGPDASVTSNSNSILAARLSYFLNLAGPSLAINTSCSSGLVALHKACLSLRYGDCDVAVVAGANVLADARSHDAMMAAGMLSESGVCAAFDKNANGMVPGEAAVVVVLRRLADAERAGDRVYASVVGSGVNYDGRTNGITAPSGAAQVRLLRDVYARVGISPESVGHLVAHGTGTRLGDPVEVNALVEAFASDRSGFCALTSTKPNIGHTQAGSGLASLVSLVLSMWHEEIPPSINCDEPSDYIRWDESPFYVNRELRPWPADGQRRGGVSAFGFSGTNAHVVLESRGTAREERATSTPTLPAHLLLVSGKNADALSRNLTRLADHLESEVDLASVSYTLMAGRHHHGHRCALVVRDRADAVRLLRDAAAGNTPPKVYRGVPAREFTPNPLIEDMLDQALRHHQDVARYQHLLIALADLYCQGYEPAYEGLFAITPALVSLPTYAFERNTYWVSPSATRPGTARLHPLVHENTSDLREQRFTSVFTGTEPFLADHVIRGTRTLPAAAYLEMARAAVERSVGAAVRLTNVRWVRPLTVTGDPVEARVVVAPDADGTLGFEITTGATVHCQGTAIPGEPDDAPVLDVAALRDRCTRSLDGADLYAEFSAVAMEYGPSHRVLPQLMLTETDTDVIVARLTPPGADGQEYVLHPGLVDGVFQVPAAFRFAGYAAGAWRTPFALDEARIFGGAGEPAWAVVRRVSATATTSRFDIDVCDEDGRVRYRFAGFTTSASSTHAGEPTTALLAKSWTASEVHGDRREWTERHVVLCDPDVVPSFGTPARVTVLRSSGDDAATRYRSLAGQLFPHVKEILESRPTHDVLLQVVVRDRLDAGLAGLLRTAQLENPKLTTQLVELTGPDLVARLDAEAANPVPEVRHADGERLLPVWQPLAAQDADIPWRPDGTYLITGGAGGLGLLFAREIARREPSAAIVLTGRSPRNERIDALLAGIGRAEYVQLDITDRAATVAAVAALRESSHPLRGVLHCAGVLRDAHVVRKSVDEFQEVLSPKVTGLSNVDLATAGDDLDFLVCFASTSGVLGNAGQADYAAGNAFMDGFATHRNEQVRAGRRHGRTLSVDWALWQDGGMSMDEQSVARMTARHGLVPIPAEDGVAAFYRALATDVDQAVCLTVAEERHLRTMADRLAGTAPRAAKPVVRHAATAADLTGYLVDTMTVVLKLPAGAVDVEEPLERYGIDSISVLALTTRLEQDFGSLPVTLFFEHQTLAEVGGYLTEAYPEETARLLGATSEPAPAEEPVAPVVRPRFLAPARTTERPAAEPSTDVAIIGLAGRYPQAPDLATFWANLLAGRNSVTEIPEDRWNYLDYYYDEDKTRSGSVYCRWGGFLDDVTRFDPLFFNISPREAAMMDPQERLFLECAYETVQDAGYVPGDLDGPAGRAGVYVGMMTADYPLFGVERQKDGVPVAVPGNFATVANRISFHLNFHGPSMAVDTMCSSSLTAISLACEALRLGNCDVAIAGGVNLSLHPNKYLVLSQGKFASSNGRCESFGDEGDGYVPCEGVGAVLLKPLDQAVRDRDHVYGVIKGTAINHGGRTNGYSVPNPNAQGDVVSTALTRAGVDPRTLSYVEAHGTGTQLGDPIEIRGLCQAFEQTSDREFCAIGSVKSNIGHAEGAAGIVGLTKILLQLRHGKLVPSLHSDVLNPYIDFAETPFVVQRTVADWTRPVIDTREVPRIAALSSFGAGGSNAHLVVAEHRTPAVTGVRPDRVAIVLSAKSDEQLRRSAERLLAALREHAEEDLASIAFTLQVGREAMTHRLGFVASGLDDAVRTLTGHLDGADTGVLAGRAGRVEGTPADDLDSLVQHWVRGGSVDWRRLYTAEPGRVSLPTYPFANETYWLPAGTGRTTSGSRPHPLLHANESDVDGLRFSSVLAGDVLSAGTMIEMARAAVWLCTGGADATGTLEFTDVVCAGAGDLAAAGGRVDVLVYPLVDGGVEWCVRVGGDADDVVAEGRAVWSAAAPAPVDRADAERRGVLVDLTGVGSAGAGVVVVPAQLDVLLGRFGDGCSVGSVRFPGSGVAAWAEVDTAAGVVRMVDADGSVVADLTGIAVDAAVDAAAAEVVEPVAVPEVAGPGRRAEWVGWTVEQCVVAELRGVVSRVLEVPVERVDVGVGLRDFGFDSITLVEFSGVLGELWGIDLTPDVFFSYPTVESLAGHVVGEFGDVLGAFYRDGSGAPPAVVRRPKRRRAVTAPRRRLSGDQTGGGIGIVGMSGRFPGARSVAELWDVLRVGRSAVGAGPVERGGSWAEPAAQGPADRVLGVVPGVAEFDPLFFEIAPREAEVMDPRQRLLLQEMWSALEDAGLGRGRLAGERVGVFVGVEEGDYRSLIGGSSSVTANSNSILAARLGYFLDFAGPSMAINTSCSSGLVALHEACLSLRAGDCDVAVVAGANVLADARSYDLMTAAGMLSESGVCAAFDKNANGMVPGEAAVVVVLRRLADAERDGDRVYASVVGSGVNYDGRTNGITAPSGAAQVRLLRDVYERAAISPDSVGHVVAHGTGTRLGDPVEVNALAEAFASDRQGFCALTSTKPNIGHTQAASGLASVVSLVLSMWHEEIPPTINCDEPSDYIRWDESPFYVNRELRPWPADGQRRGGVSAFGYSGTNAHVVLQEHGTARAEELAQQDVLPAYLLTVSGKTEEALSRALVQLADQLESGMDGRLASVSHTLMVGRHHHAHRVALVAHDCADAVRLLRAAAAGDTPPKVYRGVAAREFTPNPLMADLLDQALRHHHDAGRYQHLLAALADLYCQGYEPAYQGLFATAPAIVSLPTYPFERETYWASVAPGQSARLHPLVHANTSDFDGQRFTSVLDSLTVGTVVEMARAAVTLSTGDTGDRVLELRDVVCAAPAELAGGRVRVELSPTSGGAAEWSVLAGDETVVASGQAVWSTVAPPEVERRGVVVELVGTGGAGMVVTPAQLDACWALLGESAESYVESARFFGAGPVTSAAVAADAGTVRLFDAAGRLVADLTGIDAGAEAEVSTEDMVVEGAGVAGPGRRAEWVGWSLDECVVAELRDVVARVLGVPAERVDAGVELREFGFDSISLVEFAGVLGELWGVELTPDVFFSYPTLASLASHLLAELAVLGEYYRDGVSAPPAPRARVRTVRRRGRAAGRVRTVAGGVGIVGMSGRFPGARSVGELWAVLSEGRSVVARAPEERGGSWAQGDRWLGAVPGVAEFDPLFFEIAPREAEVMDPRQRLLLQEMWSALEDAGYGRGRLADERVGVFVGVEEGDYRALVGRNGSVTSNNNSILAARLGYFLDFAGPSMAINTSCSSGLVALHEACLSLQAGDCDVAVVAGANVLADARSYDAMMGAGMLSETGVCAAFDRNADGMVPGEAAVVVVLRRLADAERDGDRVYASVVGSGVNYDGRTNGITAPSGAAQVRLLRDVYGRAGVLPESVGHVVAHGTGTRLGDPVEVNALAEAFASDRQGFCALTSTKPNIGHTQAASGLVSVVALALSMWHEVIPPSINCAEPSDYIRWDESPFYVNREPRSWPADGEPRRGGVSAFGFSGTNAHVILQEHGTARAEGLTRQDDLPAYLLTVSGKTGDALARALAQLADHLESGMDGQLASVSHTLMAGRHHHAHRVALVVHDRADAVRLLRDAAAGNTPPKVYRGVPEREFTPNPLIEDLLDQALRHHHDAGRYQHLLAALADLYCQGYEPAYQGLFETAPAVVSLPTYPFERETYWVGDGAAATGGAVRLHPLVHANTSDLDGQRFTSRFDAESLPSPVELLEMARAAVALSMPVDGAVRLRNVAWCGSLTGGTAHVGVSRVDGGVRWAVYGDDDVIVCDGTATVVADEVERLDAEVVHLTDQPDLLAALDAVIRERLGGAALTKAAEVTFVDADGAAAGAVITGSSTVDIDLCAADGTVLLRVRGLERAEDVAPASPAEEGEPVVEGPGRRLEWVGWSVRECVVGELCDVVSRVLGVPADRVDVGVELREFGFDSILLVEFAGVLGEVWGVELTPDVFFSVPTITSLAGHLLDEFADVLAAYYRDGSPALAPVRAEAVAGEVRRWQRGGDQVTGGVRTAGGLGIVGMSGRFPGAWSVGELWNVLSEGRSVVAAGPADRGGSWADGTDRWLGAVPGVAEFDPLFFEISPREAEMMDPRQRLLLQEMWSALEDAGYGRGRLTGERVGVFVGVEEGDYRSLVGRGGSVTANSNSILAARLSYFLNLAGPSMAINTSCSSGLVALHEACLSLRAGDCDVAVVAGANVLADAGSYDAMMGAGMLSESGVCAAFDKGADGMVPGEAAVVVVLRRLADAERDGDRVYASVVGSGVNYDGRTNGITAPSGAAQVRLLRDVYERAAIAPESVGHLVAHGTATRLGDPVEVNALAEAFASDRRGFCALTSTKPNIGHTQAASGLVSVVALALSMWHEVIPPSINCAEPSDYIRWDESPFYVNRELRPWPADGRRRGGVSAFGFSGTNAHVVLQEHDTAGGERAALAGQAGLPAYLLLVSGKSADALSRALTRLADHLDTESEVDGQLVSVSYTLMAGRHHHGHRCALVVHNQADAVRLLREAAAGNTPPKVCRGVPAREFTPNPHLRTLITDLTGQARGSHHDLANYQHILTALGDLYCQGYEPAYEALFPATPAITTLPAYPFEKRHFWIDRARTVERVVERAVEPVAAGPVRLRPVTEVAAAMGFVRPSTEKPKPEPKPEPETNGRPVEPVQETVVVPVPEPQGLVESLRESLARALFLEVDEVDVDQGFTELGLDSVVGVEWIQAVNREFGCSVGTTKIYQYPTVRQFAGFLTAEQGAAAPAPVVEVVPEPVVSASGLVESLRESLARALFLDVDEVDVDQGFTELGLDSVVGVEWIQAVNREFGCSVGTTKIYQYPTVRQFAGFVAGEVPGEDDLDRALAQVYDGEIDVAEAQARLSALATEA